MATEEEKTPPIDIEAHERAYHGHYDQIQAAEKHQESLRRRDSMSTIDPRDKIFVSTTGARYAFDRQTDQWIDVKSQAFRLGSDAAYQPVGASGTVIPGTFHNPTPEDAGERDFSVIYQDTPYSTTAPHTLIVRADSREAAYVAAYDHLTRSGRCVYVHEAELGSIQIATTVFDAGIKETVEFIPARTHIRNISEYLVASSGSVRSAS